METRLEKYGDSAKVFSPNLHNWRIVYRQKEIMRENNANENQRKHS
jgi:hypothetical protein